MPFERSRTSLNWSASLRVLSPHASTSSVAATVNSVSLAAWKDMTFWPMSGLQWWMLEKFFLKSFVKVSVLFFIEFTNRSAYENSKSQQPEAGILYLRKLIVLVIAVMDFGKWKQSWYLYYKMYLLWWCWLHLLNCNMENACTLYMYACILVNSHCTFHSKFWYFGVEKSESLFRLFRCCWCRKKGEDLAAYVEVFSMYCYFFQNKDFSREMFTFKYKFSEAVCLHLLFAIVS